MATWADNLAASDGDLLGAYKFEETTGSVIDSSPAGNDGTISGTVTRGVTGKIGDAFEYTQAGYVDSGIVLPSTVTYAFWVKRDTLGTFQGIVGDRTGSANCTLYFETDGDIRYSGTTDKNLGTGITDTNWHLLMVEATSTTIKIWIDNSLELDTTDTRNLGTGTFFFGDDGQGGTNDLDGSIDAMAIWSTTLTSDQRDDYYNSGAGLEYAPPKDGSSFSSIKLRDDLKNGSPFSAIKLNHEKDGSGFTPVKLNHEKDGSSFVATKLNNEKDGSAFSTIKLNHEKQGSSFATLQLRAEGIMSYSFELYDDTGTLENSATGTPPQTVFTDIFTGVTDGYKTLYIRSVQKYKNLENTIDETMIKMRLLAGVRQPLLPNLPLSVNAEARIGATVEVSWNYNPTNQETAPTDFQVYIDGIPDVSIPYTGATSYKVTLGPLAEVSTVIGVASFSGANGTVIMEAEAVTPDGTPPATVPITFEVS